MLIKTRVRDGVTLLDLDGKIDDGDVALHQAMRGALAAGVHKFLLNLGGVTGLDSSGVGELIVLYTTATHRGAIVKLENLPPGSDILCIAQLHTVFEVFDDEDKAVGSFA
ncbi:MAG: STAS domain-containing protein [Rhodanobacter sp.]